MFTLFLFLFPNIVFFLIITDLKVVLYTDIIICCKTYSYIYIYNNCMT